MNEHDRINLQMQQLRGSVDPLGVLGGAIGYSAGWSTRPQGLQAHVLSPEEIAKEDARKQCALSMKYDRQTKRFMEKALPLDWCHNLYPEAYER